ncbi:MAG: peptidoglycan-associated lipoprotein Pal [Elusimicrobia bacterium]|nr:peptidoglycan-associated lipoprotein Pal [Elusimicrobiota bacterium]
MKSKMLLLMCAMVVAIFLAGGCAPRKAVKKTPADEGAKPPVVASADQETDEAGIDESAIPPEGSARGKSFDEVMNINLEDVHFEYDQYTLSPEARNILSKNVETLKNNPKIAVQIEGHADERGTVEYNLALGQKRASSVRAYLIAAGIDSQRIFTISYGMERPLDPAHNEEAWSKNRRAHPASAAQ